jgi:3-(3-hydroxy-phenyl)propionate hydroxylase
MGAGLRDAMNLSWKLAGVLNGDLAPTVLDTYEQERKPHVRSLIRLALTVGRLMTAGGELGNLLRRAVVPQMRRIPGLREKVVDSTTPALRRSSLVHRSRGGGPLAGTLCPNPMLPDGRRIDEVLGTGFALVSTVKPTANAEERGIVVHIADATSDLAAWLRRGHATAAVIRPDRTVMCAGRNVDDVCNAVPAFTLPGGGQ